MKTRLGFLVIPRRFNYTKAYFSSVRDCFEIIEKIYLSECHPERSRGICHYPRATAVKQIFVRGFTL